MMPVGDWRARDTDAGVAQLTAETSGIVVPERTLLELRPDLSAAGPLWRWQKWTIVAGAAVVLAGLLLDPRQLATVAALVLALPFLSVVLLRLLALMAFGGKTLVATSEARDHNRLRSSNGEWPRYAVLVPLYDEAEIIPGLVASLSALQYPADRLNIRLVVEADDAKTRAAIAQCDLPSHMGVIVAPPGEPRTKPRALNIALAQTPGDFVVVYDAEDDPEPDQLRRAVAAFQACPPQTACLQARLNTFNPDESWLARQFTIEYSALFDILLPALERFGLPVPLGGTSNHFRRAALEEAMAWDPYNVTEDADLGIRLARFGMPVGVIQSTTWEEAPPTWRIWLGQRTRWLKGWMQTYLVHMRDPRRLARELGWWPFAGLQVLMGAMIASALVHPWFYVLLGFDAWSGALFTAPETGAARYFWWLAMGNLALGYVSVAVVGAVAVWRRRRAWLLPHLALVPFYWLAISYAAYRALIELVVAPYHWEKTQHRVRQALTAGKG